MIGVTMRYTDEFKINVVKSYLCLPYNHKLTTKAFLQTLFILFKRVYPIIIN